MTAIKESVFEGNQYKIRKQCHGLQSFGYIFFSNCCVKFQVIISCKCYQKPVINLNCKKLSSNSQTFTRTIKPFWIWVGYKKCQQTSFVILVF